MPRIFGASRRPWNSTITGPCTKGAAATTFGVRRMASMRPRQSSMAVSLFTSRWASKPSTLRRSSWSKPVITEMTRMSTMIPSVTPTIEMMVMAETKVRFGWR